ncbi:MAG: sensor histidine kinase [Thiolinea sp.]
MKILQKIRHSLSLRLLLMFAIAGIVIAFLFQGMLGFAIGRHVKHQVAPHLQQYIEYVYQDIGSPPNNERAQQLAERLPIEILIKSQDNTVWQSGDIPDWIQNSAPDHHHHFNTHDGQEISYDFERKGVILRYQKDDHNILIWAKGWQRPDHRKGGFLFGVAFLLAALGLLYYFIRRLFRPIQTIQQGVQTIGSGELSHRITPARKDELGELATSINEMAEDIEQMLESKRELLLAISHELRSPLTRAKVSLALLDESKAQASITRDLKEMEAMISELLEAERLKGRHGTLNLGTHHLNDIVSGVISEHFPEANLQLNLADNLPSQQLDNTRIRLVVRNLLDNALKHQPDEAQAVILTTTFQGQKIHLSIQDHGSGIAPEHLAHLTEPFYRADASRQRKTGGFGLGLYLVKLIVDAHKGELKISSEVGKGTLTEVVLPVDV